MVIPLHFFKFRNEGYYLNRLLQNTFEDKVAFSLLHFVGWGKLMNKTFVYKINLNFCKSVKDKLKNLVVPAFPTVVYSILRSREEGLYCWAYPSSNVRRKVLFRNLLFSMCILELKKGLSYSDFTI